MNAVWNVKVRMDQSRGSIPTSRRQRTTMPKYHVPRIDLWYADHSRIYLDMRMSLAIQNLSREHDSTPDHGNTRELRIRIIESPVVRCKKLFPVLEFRCGFDG